MPVRASALQTAEHCLLANVLAEEFPGTSVYAERGIAVDKEACRDLAGGEPATDPDAKACVWWVRKNLVPGSLSIQHPVQLRDPQDPATVLSPGKPDIVGLRQITGDLTIVDIKKREQYLWGSLAPPDSNMQLHAYGMAWSMMMGTVEGLTNHWRPYTTCLLLFGDGAVQEVWSQVYTPEMWAPMLERVRRINLRDKARGDKRPVGFSGPHCVGCYERAHCHHWVLPATAADNTALAPLARGGGLTRENSERALLAWMQLGELYDQVKPMLEEFALTQGPIDVGEDRVWGPQTVRGRRSASVKDLEAAGLEGHVKQGEPTVRFSLRRR